MTHKDKSTPFYLGASTFASEMGYSYAYNVTPDRPCQSCTFADENKNGYSADSLLCLYHKDYNKTHPGLAQDFTRGMETMRAATCQHFAPKVDE